MSEDDLARSNDDAFVGELQRYKELCRRLEEENVRLREENAKMREELLSLKMTVSAVVARSIDAKADTAGRKRYKKSGRRNGHEGASEQEQTRTY